MLEQNLHSTSLSLTSQNIVISEEEKPFLLRKLKKRKQQYSLLSKQERKLQVQYQELQTLVHLLTSAELTDLSISQR